MRFQDYRNNYNHRRRIFSEEDLLNMPLGNIFELENDILAQNNQIGIPTHQELEYSPNTCWVSTFKNDLGEDDGNYWTSFTPNLMQFNGKIEENPTQGKPTEVFIPEGNDRIKFPELPHLEEYQGEYEEYMRIIDNIKKFTNKNKKEPDDLGGDDGGNGGGGRNRNNPNQEPEEKNENNDMEPETENESETADETTLEDFYKEESEEKEKPYILPEFDFEDEEDEKSYSLTGGAAPIDRTKEDPIERQNNDDFLEEERQKNFLMQVNSFMNPNRSDAKLFMDLALVNPENVPSCKDYKFISKDKIVELNKKYNLVGNKEITDGYNGFAFTVDSPTAQRLNNSVELREQILKPDNYDAKTGKFKRDKLEIEFSKDKNLNYSFGHMTVIVDHVTPDGYLIGTGYDKYDYESHYNFNDFKNNPKATGLNEIAYWLQKHERLKPYFTFVPIKVKIH